MWAEACELLDRAERLQRQFFRPGGGSAPNWEPPIDFYETEREYRLLVALPGVRPDQVEVVIDGRMLIVVGERLIATDSPGTRIHRLEIPYGRFERRIQLPVRPMELGRRELIDGCLLLTLRKL
jgi:HSP20 family molecular chaperone IbpA